jgi:hypothetical protein
LRLRCARSLVPRKCPCLIKLFICEFHLVKFLLCKSSVIAL